jgi:hypothetical protein
LEEEHTIAQSKFVRRSSSGKSAFPKGKCTIPVLSALYSTFPCLNSAIACIDDFKIKLKKKTLILELCNQA